MKPVAQITVLCVDRGRRQDAADMYAIVGRALGGLRAGPAEAG